MKQWIRSLTGLLMSAVLTLGLGGKALAGEEDLPAESPAAEATAPATAACTKVRVYPCVTVSIVFLFFISI